MNEEDFIKRVLQLVEANPGPLDTSSEDIVAGLVNEVTARDNGQWNIDRAKEIMKQFEWFMTEASKG